MLNIFVNCGIFDQMFWKIGFKYKAAMEGKLILRAFFFKKN